MIPHATPRYNDPSTLVSFEKWLEGLNLTRTTGYRYRKSGLIKAVNIFGRLYVTRDEIAEFERRALAGEFDKQTNNAPARPVTAI